MLKVDVCDDDDDDDEVVGLGSLSNSFFDPLKSKWTGLRLQRKEVPVLSQLPTAFVCLVFFLREDTIDRQCLQAAEFRG